MSKIPTWLAPLISTILATIGISDPGMQSAVKSVIGAAAGVVITWWVHEQHKTSRNADALAADIAKASELAKAGALDVQRVYETIRGAILDKNKAAGVPSAPTVPAPTAEPVPPASPGVAL